MITLSRVYRPNTPRNVACWAVITKYGYDYRSARQALVDAGLVDSREWAPKSLEQQAHNHLRWLERMGYISFTNKGDEHEKADSGISVSIATRT